MTPAKPQLRVTPELCEDCSDRDCVRACKQHAIRAGKGFVYVDWERCDACLACVEMCGTGALQARDVTAGQGQTAIEAAKGKRWLAVEVSGAITQGAGTGLTVGGSF